MKLPNLVFDIDDTLYKRYVPVAAAFEMVSGVHLSDPEGFYRIFEKHSSALFGPMLKGEMSLEAYRSRRALQAFSEAGFSLPEKAGAAFQQAYEKEQGRIAMSSRMHDFFSRAKKMGAPLFVLTNGPDDHQRKKAKSLGLPAYLPGEHLLTSGEAGAAKPDVRIFAEAEKRWGLLKEDTWMIGDDLGSDIAGAKGAGWHSLWLREGKRGEGADRCADSEEELADILFDLLHLR